MEEKNKRTPSLGIQNDDEAIIQLSFTAFVDIIYSQYVWYFLTIEYEMIVSTQFNVFVFALSI